ncbi:MerR family transcriptional regulator [Bacillus sp. 165]|uniref:MerR family transcriptional regulator n=1 Tax=Bacillus sp. 165 TaxID=1529117 RepID=UPI001ADA6DF1|nr:MerR family transcriptional regulator [Bacillus sp. 165]MBO9128993.1 MerR family transcriptional regulator [Bacillus sp. 165]
MKNRFSIGQMSKLHNIPIKTLRYYDEIGLFKPVEVDSVTGYRYYSIEQFEQLDIIYYLKTLGVPLKDIKQQLENRDIDYFLTLLKEQSKLTERKIEQLQLIKKRFGSRIHEIEKAREVSDIGIPFIKTIPERAVIQMEEPIRSDLELELSLRKLKGELGEAASIFIGKVGLTLPIAHILQSQFFEYNSVFVLLEELEEKERLYNAVTTFPEDVYACIFYRGIHLNCPPYYQRLLTFIENNQYEIKGDAIERTIIDQFISNNPKEYITEIQIPIKPLTLQ